MPDRHARGLLDTSVVIDLEKLSLEDLPIEMSISALTLAELAAGPHATRDAGEQVRREARLQRAEEYFDVLHFDASCGRAFGQVYATARAAGRSARGRRSIDLLIAATALARSLPLYTRNPDDFRDLEEIVDVVGV